jgi:hypothetical protein
VKKKSAILYRTTILEKGIKILDFECFMWIQTKQNYDIHIKQMKNLKNIVAKKRLGF